MSRPQPGPQPYGPPQNYGPPPKKKHTTRNVVLGIVGVLIIIGVISGVASGGSGDKDSSPGGNPTAATQEASQAAPNPGVSQGLGSQDASGDVKLGKVTQDEFGYVSVKIKIHNPGTKRSDYFVDLSLESPNGKTQYDTTEAFAQNVEPGQSTSVDGQFTKTDVPKSAVVRVKEVQRTASI